jgi:hypothetical protein
MQILALTCTLAQALPLALVLALALGTAPPTTALQLGHGTVMDRVTEGEDLITITHRAPTFTAASPSLPMIVGLRARLGTIRASMAASRIVNINSNGQRSWPASRPFWTRWLIKLWQTRRLIGLKLLRRRLSVNKLKALLGSRFPSTKHPSTTILRGFHPFRLSSNALGV